MKSLPFLSSLLVTVSVPVLSFAAAFPIATPMLDWRVAPVSSSQNKNISYCAMTARFKDAPVTTFTRNETGKGSLTLDFANASLKKGKKYAVTLTVKGTPVTYASLAIGTTRLVLQLSHDNPLFAALEAGESIIVSLDGTPGIYTLAGNASAFAEMNNCVANLAPQPVSSIIASAMRPAPSVAIPEAGIAFAPAFASNPAPVVNSTPTSMEITTPIKTVTILWDNPLHPIDSTNVPGFALGEYEHHSDTGATSASALREQLARARQKAGSATDTSSAPVGEPAPLNALQEKLSRARQAADRSYLQGDTAPTLSLQEKLKQARQVADTSVIAPEKTAIQPPARVEQDTSSLREQLAQARATAAQAPSAPILPTTVLSPEQAIFTYDLDIPEMPGSPALDSNSSNDDIAVFPIPEAPVAVPVRPSTTVTNTRAPMAVNAVDSLSSKQGNAPLSTANINSLLYDDESDPNKGSNRSAPTTSSVLPSARTDDWAAPENAGIVAPANELFNSPLEATTYSIDIVGSAPKPVARQAPYEPVYKAPVRNKPPKPAVNPVQETEPSLPVETVSAADSNLPAALPPPVSSSSILPVVQPSLQEETPAAVLPLVGEKPVEEAVRMDPVTRPSPEIAPPVITAVPRSEAAVSAMSKAMVPLSPQETRQKTVSAFKPAPSEPLSGWSIQTINSLSPKANDAFCLMESSFKNGTSLMIGQRVDGYSTLGVDYGIAMLKKGQEYEVLVQIDGIFEESFSAYAENTDTLVVQMGKKQSFFDSARSANALRVSMPGVASSFELRNITVGIAQFSDCLEKLSRS